MTRREEREFALKVLFAAEFQDNAWFQQLELLEQQDSVTATGFIQDICKLYSEHKEKMDGRIERHLKNWEFSRIAIIDKIILRMALTEMYFILDVPVEVSINEAVELAKSFGTDNSAKFINGVLDAVYREEGNAIKHDALKSGLTS